MQRSKYSTVKHILTRETECMSNENSCEHKRDKGGRWREWPSTSLLTPSLQLSQSTGIGVLHHTSNSHWLSLLHMVVCMYYKAETLLCQQRKVHLVKAMVFPVVMYGCESWTVKKAERRRAVVHIHNAVLLIH